MKKILVVDDDPAIRMLLADYLRNFGHEVVESDSGQSCLNELDNALPDIVLLDLQMPDMTGNQVLKEIRSNENLESLPIVMLSANEESHAVKDQEGVTADRYVQKPFDLKGILKIIEELA